MRVDPTPGRVAMFEKFEMFEMSEARDRLQMLLPLNVRRACTSLSARPLLAPLAPSVMLRQRIESLRVALIHSSDNEGASREPSRLYSAQSRADTPVGRSQVAATGDSTDPQIFLFHHPQSRVSQTPNRCG